MQNFNIFLSWELVSAASRKILHFSWLYDLKCYSKCVAILSKHIHLETIGNKIGSPIRSLHTTQPPFNVSKYISLSCKTPIVWYIEDNILKNHLPNTLHLFFKLFGLTLIIIRSRHNVCWRIIKLCIFYHILALFFFDCRKCQSMLSYPNSF